MKRMASVLVVAMLGILIGCAGSGGTGGGASEQAAPPKGVAPPADHRLAKITLEMVPTQVQEILGAPTSQNTYQTGKAWIPYYYGPDTARTEWKYKGEGRVVFGINRYSGNQRVIRIDYDPAEDGI
jgi:hypothetical protein